MCVLVFGGTKRNALHLKRPVINQSGLQLRGFLPSDKKKECFVTHFVPKGIKMAPCPLLQSLLFNCPI